MKDELGKVKLIIARARGKPGMAEAADWLENKLGAQQTAADDLYTAWLNSSGIQVHTSKASFLKAETASMEATYKTADDSFTNFKQTDLKGFAGIK